MVINERAGCKAEKELFFLSISAENSGNFGKISTSKIEEKSSKKSK